METIRLDKYLSITCKMTKQEIQECLKQGKVQIDNEMIYDKKMKISLQQKVKVNNQEITRPVFIYYMLNSVEAITLVENSRVFIPSKNISLLVNEIIYYYHKYGRINEADFYIYLEGNEELRKVYHEILQDEYPCEVSSQIVLETLKVIRESSIALEIKRLENLIKNETSVTEQMRLLEEIRVLRMKEGESC